MSFRASDAQFDMLILMIKAEISLVSAQAEEIRG